MKQIHIGEIIKQRRLELKLTQEELCEGICEPPTMSRIEKGHQTPTHSKLKALLSRLNLPSEKYYALMSNNELEIEQLKTEIASCNMRGQYLEGLNKINQLEKLIEASDLLSKQFILRCQAHLGYILNDKLFEYTPKEKLDLLFQAIHITIPNFDMDAIGSHWYSIDEMKIINQIAITYTEDGKRRTAIDLYYQLYKYIKKRLVINNDNVPIAILIAYNYSLDLSDEKRHAEALEVANWGWNISIQWGRMNHIGGLLYVLGEASYHLNHLEESKQYFIQSYYAYTLMRNPKDSQIVSETIRGYFDKKI